MNKYSIEFNDTVQQVEFAPFELTSQLVGIGTTNHVIIACCKFQLELAEVEGFEFEKIKEFHHGSRVTCFSWSPETSLILVPKVVKFCTGGGDKKLRLHTSDLSDLYDVQELEGHTSYINDVQFDPDRGEFIASVSDDHTCRIWDNEGTLKASFPLRSPGMSVRWHIEEPAKLMVAEKKGILHFYNIQTQQPIMSLDCGNMPLLSADWCSKNSLIVAASTLSDIFLFNTSESSQPQDSRQVHAGGSTVIRWSRSHSQLLATLGRPGPQLKITNMSSGQTLLTESQPILHGISWHYRLPIVAVAGDRKVMFCQLDSL